MFQTFINRYRFKKLIRLLLTKKRGILLTQSVFTRSKLTIETLEQGVNYVQS